MLHSDEEREFALECSESYPPPIYHPTSILVLTFWVPCSLAWAEMYQLLATLVQRFNFTIKDATAGDFELHKDNFGIGTKAGCNLMVHVTPRKD